MQRAVGGRLRRLAADTLVYGVTTAVVRFLTFLLTPLYTNVLTPAQLGEVSYLYALLAFVNIVVVLGWESAYMRFAVEQQGEGRKQVFGLAWAMVGLVAGIFAAVVWVVAPLIAPQLGLHAVGAEGVRLAGLIAFCDALCVVPFADLRLRRRLGLFAVLRLGNIVVMVAATVVFLLLWRWGAIGVLRAGCLASAATAVAVLPLVVRSFAWRWDVQLWKAMLRYGLPTVPAALAGIALQVMDRPLLMVLTDAHTVGIYQANYRLALPMLLVVSVFDYAWRPFFLEQMGQAGAERVFARVFLHWNGIAALAFLLLVLWMPVVIRIPVGGGYVIHPAYWEGIGIVPIVAAGYAALGIYTLAAAAAHIRKRTERLAVAMGLAAVANIVLTLVLVPWLGYVGAAWATLGAYGIAAAVMVRMSRVLYPIPYPWRAVALFWGTAVAVALLGNGAVLERVAWSVGGVLALVFVWWQARAV
jgi:O-antigen/teichoic acid export membrane protein